MSSPRGEQPSLQQVQLYLDGVAKSLVDRLYGPDGPPSGTTLTDIENLYLMIRDNLTQKMLHIALDRQAQFLAQPDKQTVTCPCCRAVLTPKVDNPRLVHTEVGQAVWNEPEAYCTRCRRAFFPSEQKPGH